MVLIQKVVGLFFMIVGTRSKIEVPKGDFHTCVLPTTCTTFVLLCCLFGYFYFHFHFTQMGVCPGKKDYFLWYGRRIDFFFKMMFYKNRRKTTRFSRCVSNRSSLIILIVIVLRVLLFFIFTFFFFCFFGVLFVKSLWVSM